MLRAVMANADWNEMVARTPLGRIGTAQDIADVVAFSPQTMLAGSRADHRHQRRTALNRHCNIDVRLPTEDMTTYGLTVVSLSRYQSVDRGLHSIY